MTNITLAYWKISYGIAARQAGQQAGWNVGSENLPHSPAQPKRTRNKKPNKHLIQTETETKIECEWELGFQLWSY